MERWEQRQISFHKALSRLAEIVNEYFPELVKFDAKMDALSTQTMSNLFNQSK